MATEDVVVAVFPIGPYGPTTQGGHYRDPARSEYTRCGKEVIDKPTTVTTIRCSACLTMSRIGTTIPAPKGGPTKEQQHG